MYYCRSADIERNVSLSQHALTHYQFRRNGSGVLQILTPKTDHLALVATLQLYLRFEDDYKHTIFLLESTPSLVSLDVEVLMDRPEYIFRSTPSAGGPRKLKSLRLECFYFENGGTTLFNMVRFGDLEELQLFFCTDYGCLLLGLSRLSLKLKSFCIDEQDTPDIQFDDNVNIFLRSLNSLERFSLALDPDLSCTDNLLDWSALEAHASTLKYLRVEAQCLHSWFPTEDSIAAFERVCDIAINLEQFAISGVDEYEGLTGKLGMRPFLVCCPTWHLKILSNAIVN
jgi:hypothetical protein